MPFISETDYNDIVFGIENGFDLSQLPLQEPQMIFSRSVKFWMSMTARASYHCKN